MSKYHNDNSFASDPVQIRLNVKRFRRIEPAAGGFRGILWRWFGEGAQFEELLDEHMNLGDSRAACVVSMNPLLVAAYTDELDCVAMLRFPDWLVGEHALGLDSRLLTVNTYEKLGAVAEDLTPGPRNSRHYTNFFPVIAEFVCNASRQIAERKASIAQEEWERCLQQGRAYLECRPGHWRNGSPLYSAIPAVFAIQT